jgi:hypothetical protein
MNQLALFDMTATRPMVFGSLTKSQRRVFNCLTETGKPAYAPALNARAFAGLVRTWRALGEKIPAIRYIIADEPQHSKIWLQ